MLALLMSTALIGQARAECSLGAVAVLPLQLQGGHFVFTATINGHDARFILDTGAFAVVLKRDSAQKFGVPLTLTDITSYGIGGVRNTYRGAAGRMQIGNIVADGMTIGAADIFPVADASGLDGLFGMNQMAAYDIDLDIPGRHAILYQATGGCRTPTVALAQPLYDVPLVYVRNNRSAEVDIMVDGRQVRATVDSGAFHTVMFRRTAARFGLDMTGFADPRHKTDHGIGPYAVSSFAHVFKVVKIGDLEFHNMPIEIIDQGDLGTSHVHVGSRLEDQADGEGGGEDMLLGADFMQKVHIWISHSSQRLIMQYPPQPSVLPH